MPTQLALRFEDVPISCPVQERYHAIAPCLAGVTSPGEQAQILNLGYSTITRWLREFRTHGLPGLVPAPVSAREPYTAEKVIVVVLYFKCCVPTASDRELTRVVENMLGQRLHHETIKSLLERYFFWRYPEFSERITYPIPAAAVARRQEMLKLQQHGWTESRIAELLHCTRKTVRKWLRRAAQHAGEKNSAQLGVPLPFWKNHTLRDTKLSA